MWMQDEYQGYEGKYWSLPPRKVLPKPYVKPHPAMWYAAGNTSELRDGGPQGPRRARLLGSATSRSSRTGAEAYKKEIPNAEPVGAFVNDNVMVAPRRYVAEDGRRARQQLLDYRPNYLRSNVFRYHDTFPHPPHVPPWPELIPDYTPEIIESRIEQGR